MTGGVEQTLARIVMPKATPDRRAPGKGGDDFGFGQALGAVAKTGPATQTRDTTGDHPQWSRFGTRLDATINRTSGLGLKLDLPSPEPDVVEDPEGLIASEEPQDLDNAARSTKSRKTDRAEKEESGDDRILVGLNLSQCPENSKIAKAAGEPPAVGETDEGDTRSARSTVASSQSLVTHPAGEASRPIHGNASAAARTDHGTGRNGDEGDSANDSSAENAAPRPARMDRPAAPNVEQQGQQPISRPEIRSVGVEDRVEKPELKPARSPGEPSRAPMQVTILSEQSIPAPTQSTSLVLAQTLASSGALKPASGTSDMKAVGAPIGASPVHSLSIQLHPAELGMVTASLRFAGEQLTIEIQVESNEAYRALVADTESLSRSLRGMGYDIDRVTILQPVTAPSAQTRPDAAMANPSYSARAGEHWGSGASGSGGTGSGGQQQEGGGGNARSGEQNGPLGNIDRPGDGVYI